MPVAMDPERMRVVLAQHLPVPDGPPVEVVACAVEFARRGPSRTLFQYRVTLRDPAAGHERTQVVSGITSQRQRTRLIWQHLRRQQPAPAAAGAALVRAAYVPELDLLLQVYPFDHRLPALEPLMVGPLPGLRAPLLAQFGPGAWQLEAWSAEPVRYRVDMRASVRLSVRAREAGTGEVAERHFFAKIYGGAGQAARAWSVQRACAAAPTAGDAPLATAPTAGDA